MIHGQTRRMKLNPPSILIRIEGLLSGGQDRVDQGQDGTGTRRRKDESGSSWRFQCCNLKKMIFSSLENI